MTKRQRNHKTKVYYEKYFKKHSNAEKNLDGYKVIPWYEPQGKGEVRKLNLLEYAPKRLLTWYKDNPYSPYGGVTLYVHFDSGAIKNMNNGEVFKYNKKLGEYQLVTVENINL